MTPDDPAPLPPTPRVLLTLAWPIVVARATQAVVGFCDALMVAPLGEDVLAAVTTGALNVFTFVMLPLGTVFILQSFAAQLRGRGELAALRRYALQGLFLALCAGVLAAAAIPFLDTALGLLNSAPEVRRTMASYMGIRLWSVAAIVGVEALGNWYGGLGNTRIALFAGLLTMVLNVIGNALLIEPCLGLPGYGAAGAAWASALSSWAGFGLVLTLFLRGYGHALPRGPLEWRAGELGRVLRFGLPNGVNWFLEFGAFALFINVVVGHLGTTVLAAFNVVLQINSMAFMPAFGVASAGAILVGEAIGRRRYEQVWTIVRMTLGTTCAWMVSVGILYALVPEWLLGWFAPRSGAAPELLGVGRTMLMLCGFWQLFDAIAMTFSEALRAAGDTVWPMVARIVLAWFFFTPVAWTAVIVCRGGATTVMVSLIVYLAALALTFAWRYGSGRWRGIDLVGGTEPQP